MEREQCLTCTEFKEDTDNLAHYSCPLTGQTGISMFPLETSERFFGFLLVHVEQAEGFTPYEPFLKNFANSIAITLENRWQRERLETANAELRTHREHLEELVEERSAELVKVNKELQKELAERKGAEEELKKHREHLEELVAERTKELKTMLNAMAGREVRMAELKDVIKQLRVQLEQAGMVPVADDSLASAEMETDEKMQ